MSPDRAARMVIIAAYAYYVLDQPVMDDGEYDKLSRFVARNWDDLHRDRQWALDTPDAMRTSGAGIYFSWPAVRACYNYMRSLGVEPRLPFPTKWKQTKKGRDYVTATVSG